RNSVQTFSTSFIASSINDAGTIVYYDRRDEHFNRWTLAGGNESLLAPQDIRPAFMQPDDGTRPELSAVHLDHAGVIGVNGGLRNFESALGLFAQSTASRPAFTQLVDTNTGSLSTLGSGVTTFVHTSFSGDSSRALAGWRYDNGGGFDEGIVFVDRDGSVAIQDNNGIATDGLAISDNGKYGVYLAASNTPFSIGVYDLDTDDITTGFDGDEDRYIGGEGVFDRLTPFQQVGRDFSVNNEGVVAFRALDDDGNDAVWLLDAGEGIDNATLTRALGTGDTLLLNGTLVRLEGRGESSESIGQGVSLNDAGDFASTWRYSLASDNSGTVAGSVAIVSIVPEPATTGLAVIVGLAVLRRRR
ncbi:MAG: hypothetical protein AAGK78_12945, partial [Planctomycetota bacterium]